MQKFIFTVIFLSNIVFAIEKVFIREYTYKASDYDSKVTARVNALNQVSELLLREVGVYIKSETKWDKKEINYEIEEIYEKKMDVITAGITKVEIIDEKWNWGEYWVKAKVTLNPKNIKKKIDDLIKNKEIFDQYEQLEKKNDEANKEIERLRKELANVKSKNEQLELSKLYNKQVDKLSAQDWYNKAVSEYQDGNLEKAVTFYLKSSDLDPHSFTYNNIGIIYTEIGKEEQAKENFLKSIELSPNRKAYYNLGLYYDNQGLIDQAEKNYIEAIKIDPYFYDAYNNLGIVFGKKSMFKQSEEILFKAIEINPEKSSPYFNIGSNYFIQGMYDLSETFYFKALNLDQDFIEKSNTYLNLGIIFVSKGMTVQAEKFFLQAIDLTPRNSTAYYHLGNIYFNNEMYEHAEIIYLKLIELDPDDIMAYLNLGLSYSAQDLFSQSEKILLRAVELDPEFANAYVVLGNIYFDRDSDNQKRIKYYKKAAQLGDENTKKWLKDNGYTW